MASTGDSITKRFVLVPIQDLDVFKQTFTNAHKDLKLEFHPGIVDGYKQGVFIIGTSKLSVDNAHSVITNWLANKDKQEHEEASQLLQKLKLNEEQ